MQQTATLHVWTSGIVNVPLDPKLKDSRYTLFELDNKNISQLHEVLDVYDKYLHSVYVHETLKGFHFYNLTPIDKELYGRILREIKHLNTECPMTTLRLFPNKWENEDKYWKMGAINGYSPELAKFRDWLENGKNHMITLNYQVVRYPFEECPECETWQASKHVYWDSRFQMFMCKVHKIQTKGRLTK